MRLNLIEIIFFSVYISVSIKLAGNNFTSLKNDMLMCSLDSSWRIQTMLQESGNPSSGNPRGWPLCLCLMVQVNDQRIQSHTSYEFFSLLLLFTEYKVFLCNWCSFWQSKTRVFLLTRQMLALTATVLTVLKATTQDQCVLCVCCYLLMVIMMRKYAVTLELFGRKTPSYAHLIIAIAYFSPPHACCPFG